MSISKRIILVDADTLLYMQAIKRQETLVIKEGNSHYYLQWADHQPIWDAFLRRVEEIGELWHGVPMICLTDSAENWRKAIWPAYKSNRSAPKPLALLPIRDLLTKREDVCLRPGLEADDVIGILATRWSFLDEWDHNVVIWSVDKDLLTIPGKHADIKNPGSIFRVTSKEADYQWWLQTLTGDTSDGYPGLPGFGPVKAKKWLDTHGASWASVREAFIQHGSNEEEARIQATMARILRAEDYDFTKKEVRPWKPPLIPDTPTRETTT